jgi:PqqD family protein of HPr-rel-A system
VAGTAHDEACPAVRWRAAEKLIWTQYEDGGDWVVYNPASTSIHLLTGAARQLWTLVSSGPPSPSEDLAARLAAELGRPLDDELATAAGDALSFMDHAGLIRPVLP